MIKPIEWMENKNVNKSENTEIINKFFPPGIANSARSFHRQIKDYKITPLKNLAHLSAMINVGGIWVKDESQRLNLNSFKVLGGSFAVYNFLKTKLELNDKEISLAELKSKKIKKKLGDIKFAAATDGNHGMGMAWAAKQAGFDSIIYVHKNTTQPRINAIKNNGAEVVIVDGTYDDAVRKATADSKKNGWQVISDTSWENYEDIPKWVMQGYTTMFSETQEQLAAQGIIKPTHIFVQAGVGALAAATIGYYRQLFDADSPKFVVVEPDKAQCLFQSARISDGKPYSFLGDLNTIMAGLACGDPSPIAWDILRDYTDAFVVSPDYVAAKAMRVYGVPLAGDPFIVSGESGAVTLGALMFTMCLPEYKPLRKHLGINRDSQILLINTEGNTDPDDFRQVVWEGSNPVPKRYSMINKFDK
ncbi:MAG: diaminopropionate ammonia-lyase [Ignavibacteriae bacterium]|nr:diaminopropionate ammonia-lyase [Ignavibacteriota bacterium]NOG98642.1 diaminopropionate ammonia-lyase [Ignavibacteriota bacterium]